MHILHAEFYMQLIITIRNNIKLYKTINVLKHREHHNNITYYNLSHNHIHIANNNTQAYKALYTPILDWVLVCLSVGPSVFLSVCPSVCLSVLCLSVLCPLPSVCLLVVCLIFGILPLDLDQILTERSFRVSLGSGHVLPGVY